MGKKSLVQEIQKAKIVTKIQTKVPKSKRNKEEVNNLKKLTFDKGEPCSLCQFSVNYNMFHVPASMLSTSELMY